MPNPGPDDWLVLMKVIFFYYIQSGGKRVKTADNSSPNPAHRENEMLGWKSPVPLVFLFLPLSLFSPQLTWMLSVGGLLFLGDAAHGPQPAIFSPWVYQCLLMAKSTLAPESTTLQLFRKCSLPFSCSHTRPSACPQRLRLLGTLCFFLFKGELICSPAQTISWLFMTSHVAHMVSLLDSVCPTVSTCLHPRDPPSYGFHKSTSASVSSPHAMSPQSGTSVEYPQWVFLQYSVQENHDNNY